MTSMTHASMTSSIRRFSSRSIAVNRIRNTLSNIDRILYRTDELALLDDRLPHILDYQAVYIILHVVLYRIAVIGSVVVYSIAQKNV